MGCTRSLSFIEPRCVIQKSEPDGFPKTPRQNETYIREEEKLLIKRQWRVLSADIKGTGTSVFMELFKLNPEMKQLFPFRNVRDAELLEDADFKRHGIRFMQAISATIENIDDLEKSLRNSLISLGKLHINFTGFKLKYFETFKDAIANVWRSALRSSYNKESEEAWNPVILFIMDNLKLGHRLAVVEAQQKC